MQQLKAVGTGIAYKFSSDISDLGQSRTWEAW